MAASLMTAGRAERPLLAVGHVKMKLSQTISELRRLSKAL